mgnify:CR=1 FL=1
MIDKGKVYDELCEDAKDLFKHYDPCKIKMDPTSGITTCSAGEPCCGDCGHLGQDGCTVEALECRMWH